MKKVFLGLLIASFLTTSGMAEEMDVIPTPPSENDAGAPPAPAEPMGETVKPVEEAKPKRNPARKKPRRKKHRKHRRHHR